MIRKVWLGAVIQLKINPIHSALPAYLLHAGSNLILADTYGQTAVNHCLAAVRHHIVAGSPLYQSDIGGYMIYDTSQTRNLILILRYHL